MSLMKMATKVAIGFAVAKGLQKMTQGGSASAGTRQSPGGLGDIMKGLQERASGGTQGGAAPGGGGLGDMLGQMTGGKGGGLGDMLGQMTGGQGGNGGGLGDLLGKMSGGGAGDLGGLGGILGGLANARGGDTGSSLEDLLGRDNPAVEPEPEQTGGLMIRAMLMAARADGDIDAGEKETLMATIGEDASADDMAFVKEAMNAPVSAATIAADTPKGLETQVYSMSVMSITPDNREEAKYLHELATALGIGQATANEIHDSFGVPRLYA